uniref:Mucin-5AC-like n=1 Tax=Sinocyclocheilus grahami TaxID=75366 RepID=A0A672MA40_SINGR
SGTGVLPVAVNGGNGHGAATCRRNVSLSLNLAAVFRSEARLDSGALDIEPHPPENGFVTPETNKSPDLLSRIDGGVLPSVGGFGRFQKQLIVLTWIPAIFIGFSQFSDNFLLAQPKTCAQVQRNISDPSLNVTQAILNINNASNSANASSQCIFLADWCGRHPVLILSVIFMLIFGMTVAFSVNVPMFSTLRFFEGFCLAGITLSLYALMCNPGKHKVYLFSFIRIFPESLRWLLATQQYNRSKWIMERVAKKNNINLEEDAEELMTELNQALPKQAKKTCIVKMVGTRNLWKNIVVLLVIRSQFTKYYTISTNPNFKYDSGTLNSNFSMAFSIIGMFSSHAVSNLSIFFCAEITPTVIRGGGLGLVLASAGFGMLTAPIMELHNQKGYFLHHIIFACCTLICIICILLLPETRNRPLPETLADGESYTRQPLLPPRKPGEQRLLLTKSESREYARLAWQLFNLTENGAAQNPSSEIFPSF